MNSCFILIMQDQTSWLYCCCCRSITPFSCLPPLCWGAVTQHRAPKAASSASRAESWLWHLNSSPTRLLGAPWSLKSPLTRPTQEAALEDTHHPPRALPLSKPRGFPCSKQRCSVILNRSISTKMCSQAAEMAQEFKPAALKKKPRAMRVFLQAEHN